MYEIAFTTYYYGGKTDIKMKKTLWIHHMKFVVAVFKNLNKATTSTLKPFLFHGQAVHQYINGY